MRKIVLALLLAIFTFSACLPYSGALSYGARPEKATPSPLAGNSPLASATAPPLVQPTTALLPPTITPAPFYTPVSWPAPYTYGRPAPLPTAVPPPAQPFPFQSDTVNILLLGSDRRTSRFFRTDTIIVLSIQPHAGGAVMLSIPRDLYVYIPGYTMSRVNTAYLYGELYKVPGGGVQMLSDTMLYNLGIKIDHYALIEMRGFEALIDALGGVEVPVACAYTDWRLKAPGLYDQDPDNWELHTVSAGVHQMPGEYALWYARSRKRSSDFDRGRRQQEVLKAIYKRILSLELIPRIPNLYQELTGLVETDLSLADLLSLAPLALRLDLNNVRSRFISSEYTKSWTTPTGGAVQLPLMSRIAPLVQEAFDLSAPDPFASGPEVAIEILNSSTQEDWDQLAAQRLEYAGYAVTLLPDNPTAGTPSHLIDFGTAAQSERARIIEILGLNANALAEIPTANSRYAYRLVIGADYKACFNPTKDQGQ